MIAALKWMLGGFDLALLLLVLSFAYLAISVAVGKLALGCLLAMFMGARCW